MKIKLHTSSWFGPSRIWEVGYKGYWFEETFGTTDRFLILWIESSVLKQINCKAIDYIQILNKYYKVKYEDVDVQRFRFKIIPH